MSTSTEVITLADMRTSFLNKARVTSPGGSSPSTATTAMADHYLNTASLDIHTNPGHKAPWAERPAVLITHAPYTTGTISITAAARTTVTGSSTLWNTAVPGFGFNNARIGGKMQFGSLNEIYTVSNVGSDTAITLGSVYTGDALTDSSYVYFEDEYSLVSDFGGFVDLKMFSTAMEIPLIGAMDFRRSYSRNNMRSRPKVACHIQLGFSTTTAPRHRVVFHPVPNDEYSVPYWYRTTNLAVTSAGVEQARLVDTTDEPIAPIRFRGAIVLHALYHYYRDFKDDTRSQEVKSEYVDLMTRISGEVPTGGDRPRFIASLGGRGHRRQRFDVGDRFDSLRDRR